LHFRPGIAFTEEFLFWTGEREKFWAWPGYAFFGGQLMLCVTNVNECNGEGLSPMGEYGIDPAGTNEFLPSRFVLVYARVWHSAKWLENVRYAT